MAKAALAITITEADDGKTVAATPGDTIVLCLHENASTGYRWAFDALDEAKIEQVTSDYLREGGTEREVAGSGGEMTWTLQVRAKARGSTPIKLKLWRSFVGDKSIQQRFTVTLKIRSVPAAKTK